MKKLVLFDIDRTLIKDIKWDSKGWKETWFSEAIKEVYGIDTRTEDIEKHSGMTDQEKITAMLKKKGLKEKDIMAGMKTCIKILTKCLRDDYLNNSKFIVLEGVRNLLEKLRVDGVLIGIVTGNISSIAKAKLMKVGLHKYFKFGAFAEDSKDRYGLVKIAIRRAKKFGFKSNNNIFLVGDTPRDVKAAKEAGIKSIGITSGVWSERQLKNAGADFILKNLKDVNKFLKIINNAYADNKNYTS